MPHSRPDPIDAACFDAVLGRWSRQGRRVAIRLTRLRRRFAARQRRHLRALLASLKLENWPFALKMAFGPALAMLVLVGVCVHASLAVNRQAALIRAAVRQDLATATHLSQSATELQQINGLVYRLTTLQASRAPNLDVARETAGLAARAAALARTLAAQARNVRAAGDQREIRQLVTAVALYRGAIEVFGSMLELDFASAVEFIRPFDANATQVLARIDMVASHAIQDASGRAAASTHLAERIRLAVIAASVISSLLLFGIVALLTKATVSSVKRIAAATASVARGNSAVDVAALTRGDELGTIVRSLAVFRENVAQIAFLAHHDSLTGLPNRALFHDRVEQALAQFNRGIRCAVLCLDLDRFKLVNDTFGHPVGDALLREVAARLKASVREGDTVARMGGDEFTVVLVDAGETSAVDDLAARMIHAIGASYEIDGHQINISTSIGIAIGPDDGSTAYELLRNADTALGNAKASERGTASFYDATMNVVLQARRTIEAGLRKAIAREELRVYYQPMVDARQRRLRGFEALVRWQHPEMGMVLPDKFVPVAESCGMIGEIGRWVLRRACIDASQWPDEIKLAVNLSPLQFREKNLVNDIRSALAASRLPPLRLELEITESVLLHDSEAVLATLQEIKSLGVHISMDDFGTGYSAISYLRSFPFDTVKIDRSFIKDLPYDKNSLAIVRAIIGLGEAFGMSVTAEGVETDPQAIQLAMEACTELQGFLFSRPVPVASVPSLITELADPAEPASYGSLPPAVPAA